MSSTDGESGMRNMTDKATYERLEKECNSREKRYLRLNRPDHDVLNSFAGTAQKQARRGYKQARRQCRFGGRRHVGARQRHDGCRPGRRHSLEESLEDVITQRPLATVGLALGLGFLIGATWRR